MTEENDQENAMNLAELEEARNKGHHGRLWSKFEKRLWIACLCVGCAILYSGRTVLPLCLVTISKEFKWNKKDAGAALSSFYWGYAMTQILGGYLSDRIGGEHVVTHAAIGWACVTLSTPMIPYLFTGSTAALSAIVIIRSLLGCFQGVHFPSMTSLLCRGVLPTERALSYSLAGCGTHIGTLISGSIGSILLVKFGWQYPFYAIGIVGLMWVAFIRFYVIAISSTETIKDNSGPSRPVREPVPWGILVTKPAFWAVVIGHFCHNNSYHLIVSWLPAYFEETFPQAKGWVFNVVPWTSIIITRISAGWFADFLLTKGHSTTRVRKLMSIISLGGLGFFLALMSQVTSFQGALFVMTLATSCSGFHNSGIIVNSQDIAPKYSGSVFGVVNTAGSLPGFLGVYVAGYILEVTHSWSLVFNLSAVICFIGLTVYLIFGTGKKII